MTKVDYRFTQNESGNFVFRSIVNSFGLENVTDKDISSFYHKFSDFAYQDTGLLPVNGTGLLSVRSAGNHMQIAYQYEPGMYRINWGKNENDPGAQAYHVAQPYRIVIGDFLNGNFYGARIFYSLEPVTWPGVPLYHVNLPNINCRGYRGNGVGWVCLYHNHNVTEFPFNEKLIYLLDRCSGAEAYNDANMSETDGPRFYKSHYKNDENYRFLWDPEEWQIKSQNDGIDWTFHPDYWIPVLVSGIDDQKEHNESGIPLTFEMAIFGNYAAYYDDKYLPKPINAIARNDLEFDVKQVFDWFKQSYNNSGTEAMHINSFEDSAAVKEKNIEQPTIKASSTYQEEEEEENSVSCGICGDSHSHDDTWFDEANGSFICEYCRESNYKWSEWHEEFVPNDFAVWCNTNEQYYDIESSDVEIVTCPKCEAIHISVTSLVVQNANTPPEVTKSSTTVTPNGCNQCKPEETNTL